MLFWENEQLQLMQNTIKVFFLWQPNEELLKYLRSSLSKFSNVKLIIPSDFAESTLISFASDADIMIGWRPTLDILKAAPKLSLFINPGAGVQNLIESIRQINKSQNLTLVNNHGNAHFTAQHGVGILLALTNKIIIHHNWIVDGLWRKGDKDAISIPLQHRKVGLLGYGAVNQKVHQFLSGFDLEFAIMRKNWDKQTNPTSTPAKRFDFRDLDSFLTWTDTLIVSMPLTVITRGLIGEKELKLLGKNGIMINLSRGLIFDEESLFNACKNKTILGAAIDVWYEYNPEPDESGKKRPYNYPFHDLDNVVLSPHRAASPFTDLKRWDDVIENIIRFVTGSGNLLNVVSLEDEY
jgi:phosphoglycerate dehydrogenase-like enzyme